MRPRSRCPAEFAMACSSIIDFFFFLGDFLVLIVTGPGRVTRVMCRVCLKVDQAGVERAGEVRV